MSRKQAILIIIFVFIHTSFIMISYFNSFLFDLSQFVDPIIVERTLLLFQFFPLLMVVSSSELSRSKILLFLAFAMCISALFVVDDFNMGFYAAAVDPSTGMVPRMRTSAHMMAYQDTGKLVSLEYHAEYFLEFLFVHLLSEISSLNYILSYFFVIRIFSIVIWSLLFVWSSSLVADSGRRLWVLLLATSILLANQSYNYEVSFAPVLLLTFYLLARKQKRRVYTLLAFSIAVAILLASFRETQLLGLISMMALLAIPLKSLIPHRNVPLESTHSKPYLVRTLFSATMLILVFARTFLLTSSAYSKEYANQFLRLVNSLPAILRGSIALREPFLVTLEDIQNPLDNTLAILSVVFAVGFLALIAILSIRLVSKRGVDSFSLAIAIVFIGTLAIAATAYAARKILGTGPIHDFSSLTIPARSLAPLALLAMLPYFQNTRRRSFPAEKLLLILVAICLSLTLVFAPFIFARKEAKSSYDMVRVSGDYSEYTLLGNNMYAFAVSYIPPASSIRILTPETGFLRQRYRMPLAYEMGANIAAGPMNISLESRLFDNSIFTISTSTPTGTIFLDEQQLVKHW